MAMRIGSQRLSSSSPNPRVGRRSRSNCSSSPSLSPTPPGAPRTLGPVPGQAMARAAGSSGGGCSSRHPQFAQGRWWPRCSQLRIGNAVRRQGRPPLQQLYETVRDIRRPEPGPRDGLLGSWLQAAIPEPGAGRVRLFGKARLHSTPRCSHRPSALWRWRFAGRGRGGTDNSTVQ